MLQYILECIAFQLVFLAIYDFFLKRETFFQWNRAYLIGTYILSLLLPWIKIEAFKSAVPDGFYAYPEYLWGANDAATATVTEASGLSISWEQGLLYGGMLMAALLFGFKMLQLYRLRQKGKIHYFEDFTRIVLADSNVAFSFFKSIFLGDRIVQKEHGNIIEHELVHIRQRHTYDLLFFEGMRILGWFNPLVYVYQNRISELHEFIADAHVAKTDREEHYELLLSQVFQTQSISFINQFFKSSLIKKRIVMLTKEKSRRIWKVKYLALVPLLIGMLFYTSCDRDAFGEEHTHETITVGDIENLNLQEEKKVFTRLIDLSEQPQDWELLLKDTNTEIIFSKPLKQGSVISGPNGFPIKARMTVKSDILDEDFNLMGTKLKGISISGNGGSVPFGVVEEVPVFPGCENAADPRACFQEKMQKHISKYFRYPDDAQKQGIQGRVSVMFTIDEQGAITDIRKRGPHPLLEDETVRIIEKLPQMQPGKSKEKPVRVPFSIPITFKLQQAGFNPHSQDANYVTLQEEQISEMPGDMQRKYRNGIPFAQVENVPVFPGCEDASDPSACFQEKIQKHIADNFRYPQVAQKKNIQGRVSILFLIDAVGNITNIATRGPDASLEDEAARIISQLPKMKPGSEDGKNVNVPFAIPINFKLR
ncbi:M56 family metallopeptidase [Pricia sp. S334]|uniref:M56 family metallopeptidase n=1 Tax=Pricia mediterranea TaxID=3076079 RepID=A0ABU3L7R6_9FLAO|nr:M56 family metallopeptidase [Pricia sp. S334]MDT7829408.1 M56 family metallopeptidase [Pricia sp. S334]